MADMQHQTGYSTAINRKYPEQVVIAIAKDANGIFNPITLGWIMITSHQPPMLAISIAPQRYSCECVRNAREFVVSFPSEEMAKDALFYGTRSGRDMDKIKTYGTETQPCEKTEGVIFTHAVANFECRLASELVTGDHVLFVGEVIQSWVNSDKTKKRLYTLGSGYKMGGAKPEHTVEYSADLFK